MARSTTLQGEPTLFDLDADEPATNMKKKKRETPATDGAPDASEGSEPRAPAARKKRTRDGDAEASSGSDGARDGGDASDGGDENVASDAHARAPSGARRDAKKEGSPARRATAQE